MAVHAQFLRTSYFLDGTSYRQQLNPALMPERGYINIPVIGALNATLTSSSLGMQDVMDIIENSSDGDYFMSNDFLNRLDNQNNLSVNLSTDILSVGWYKGKNFWSFNVGLRNDIGISIPRNTFEFMRKMRSLEDNPAGYGNLNEQFGGQNLHINSFAEVGVGFARSINSRLTVGGKVKMLLGIGNMELNVNDVQVNSNVTGWDMDGGYMDPSQVSGSASIRVDASLESSSKLLDLPQSGTGYIDEIEFGSFGFAGYGAAIDLGVSYRLLDKLTLSASVLDLGFLKWSKGNTTVATARTDQSYGPENIGDFIHVVNSGEVLNFDMLQLTEDKEAAKGRATGVSPTLTVGAEYALLNDWLIVGALYTGRFVDPETVNELTLSANVRPSSFFNFGLSYSLLQGAGKTFGLALKLGTFFIGTDYMCFGKNTRNVNAYLGISIPLGARKAD